MDDEWLAHLMWFFPSSIVGEIVFTSPNRSSSCLSKVPITCLTRPNASAMPKAP